jgi:hypothetical protein
MDGRTPARCAVFVLASTLFALPLFAQYVCEYGNGPLNTAAPAGITPAEIIDSFATREAALKAARDRYAYTLDVTIETLNGNAVNGSYHQLSEVSANEQGQRVERVTFAPQSTLQGLGLTKDDLDDIRDRLPLVLKAQELSLYSITYVGRQHVDQLETYVFDVAPKDAKPKDPKPKDANKEPRRFHGRVWVEARDLVIVKTCGKTRGDEIGGSLGKNLADLTPTFVTYREQMDGKFWFTTYARADEYLHFPAVGVHIREVVKYSNYKAPASK